MFFDINNNGKIMLCAETKVFPHLVELFPPTDFNPEFIQDWKVNNGVFSYEPQPQEEPQPTQEERLAALEEENKELKEALNLLLEGATE